MKYNFTHAKMEVSRNKMEMNIMRKYIIGFIVGASLASTATAFADDGLQKIEAYLRPDLPITINGEKTKLESSPVVVDGSTYLKLRDIAKLTNTNVSWNEQTQTVEMSTYGNPLSYNSELQHIINIDESNFDFATFNNESYVKLRKLAEAIIQYGYSFKFNKDSKTVSLVYNNDPNKDVTKNSIVIDNIPFQVINDETFVKNDYYVNVLKPLIK